MKCSEVQYRLSAFLDGEAPPKLALDIKAHLAECAECRQAADELSLVYNIISQWRAPQPAVPLKFIKPVALPRPKFFRWMAAAACIAGLFAGGVMGRILWNNSDLSSDIAPSNEIITSWNLDVLGEWTHDSVEAVYMNLASLNQEVPNNE